MKPDAWLKQTGPLTVALKKAFPDWEMKVLSQNWDESTKTWVREIVHTAAGKKLVYAKLEAPEKTYRQYQTELESLGGKPIGVSLLYGNPDVTRSGFTYRQMPCAFLGEGLFWARASCFYWKAQPLYLTEIFTPDLPELI